MKSALAIVFVVFLAACATVPDAAPVAGSDEFQIEATVLAVYNVVSGPAGRRDWNRFEDLFAPGAVLVIGGERLTPKEFAERWKPKLNETALFERPVATQVLREGDIAHVWSTYERREASNQEKATATGVRSFQLVRAGGDWKVQSILSQKE